jgi:prepilin signal peptidase PulO-like enzyme (type II secretory pathway)
LYADIRYGLLPDKFLCPLLWAGLLFQLCIQPDFLPSAVVGAMADISALPLFTGDIGLSAGVKGWDMAM